MKPAAMAPKKCILILGMHKSGGSALAGCLDLMGFNLGASRGSTNQPNQPGTFENRDISLTHDILLRDLGCAWDMVGALPENWEQTDAAKKAEETIVGILKNQFLHQNGPFAIKDPRMCRLMPLWNRVMKNLEIQPSIILLLRHPMEVAKSLNSEHGFDFLKAHLLWLVHNREALAACKDHDHALISFDQLLADPITTLLNTAELTALSGLEPHRHAQDILGFIRPEFKNHHQSDSEQIQNGFFRHYAWVYDQFRTLQAKSQQRLLQHTAGNEKSTPEDITEFPLAVSGSGTLPAADDRKNAAEVFDNLLNIIGRYEQKEQDQSVRLQRRLLESTSAAETIFTQIFFPDTENQAYTSANAKKILLAPEEWQQVSVEIPDPTIFRTSSLCLAPLNTRGMVFISGIKLINSATGRECWSSDPNFSEISVERDALVLAQKDTLQLATTGGDPRILFSTIPDLPDSPMHLQFWIKPVRKQNALHDYWGELKAGQDKLRKQVSNLEKQLKAESQKKDNVKEQLENLKNDFAQKETDLQKQIQEKEQSISDLRAQIREKDNSISDLNKQLSSRNQEFQTQEDLTRQYFQALEDAEQEQEKLYEAINNKDQELTEKQQELGNLQTQLQKEEQSLTDLKAQIQKKDSSITDLNQQLQNKDKELKNQEDLTRQYFQALADAEQEQEKLRGKLRSLEKQNKDLTSRLKIINKQFTALLGSKRFRLGNGIGKFARLLLFKRPAQLNAVTRIREKLREPEKQQKSTSSQPARCLGSDRELIKTMERLNKQFQILMRSRRWRMGNCLVNIASKLSLRTREPISVNRMQEIFADFQEWRKTVDPDFLSLEGKRQLHRWLDRLEKDFQALLVSRRLRLGNTLATPLKILRWREKRPRATDRMKEIFARYRYN